MRPQYADGELAHEEEHASRDACADPGKWPRWILARRASAVSSETNRRTEFRGRNTATTSSIPTRACVQINQIITKKLSRNLTVRPVTPRSKS